VCPCGTNARSAFVAFEHPCRRRDLDLFAYVCKALDHMRRSLREGAEEGERGLAR
jgi:hypothetical protein